MIGCSNKQEDCSSAYKLSIKFESYTDCSKRVTARRLKFKHKLSQFVWRVLKILITISFKTTFENGSPRFTRISRKTCRSVSFRPGGAWRVCSVISKQSFEIGISALEVWKIWPRKLGRSGVSHRATFQKERSSCFAGLSSNPRKDCVQSEDDMQWNRSTVHSFEKACIPLSLYRHGL